MAETYDRDELHDMFLDSCAYEFAFERWSEDYTQCENCQRYTEEPKEINDKEVCSDCYEELEIEKKIETGEIIVVHPNQLQMA